MRKTSILDQTDNRNSWLLGISTDSQNPDIKGNTCLRSLPWNTLKKFYLKTWYHKANVLKCTTHQFNHWKGCVYAQLYFIWNWSKKIWFGLKHIYLSPAECRLYIERLIAKVWHILYQEDKYVSRLVTRIAQQSSPYNISSAIYYTFLWFKVICVIFEPYVAFNVFRAFFAMQW